MRRASRVPPPTWGARTTLSRGEQGGMDSGLALEDVEGGAGEVAACEGVDEGLFVDDGAAGHVDEPGAGLHAGEAVGVEQMLRSCGERGGCRETKSDSASRASRARNSGFGETVRRVKRMFMPKARARCATA